MIISSNHVNQSFVAAGTSLLNASVTTTTTAPLSAFRSTNTDSSGAVGGGGNAAFMNLSALAAATSLDINNLPIDQLLHNDWFYHNASQMLNISIDNLTSLLINAQQQKTAEIVDPPWLVVTLTIFYSLIFVAGVLGNLITCIVISRNKFMHTATNFYLFNLAVSDLILLLSGMPPELYNIWYPDEYPFTDLLCKMEGIFSETAANATVLTITAFTVERYIAICHPFRQHTMSKLSRAIKFIFAIWVTAFLLALPQAMQFSVVPQNDGLSCTMKNDFFVHVFAVSGFIFFGGPMTAICVLYVLIGVKLKRSRLLQAVPRRCYDVNRGISAQSRVIRMLVAVAVAFFLCWAPFHAQRLMAAYGITVGNTQELYNDIYYILNYISGVLYFLSTCINPLLYNIMSHKFREAFKVTLARHFGLKGKYQTQNHNYSALLRQNGSMRLHTTVNNNAFEHFNSFNSYRVVQLSKCRDPTHHLSLQDSIRTTTTTATNNSIGGIPSSTGSGAQGGNNSCRSSHRNRCISIGSQSTLLSKTDIFNAAAQRGSGGDHRVLQTQTSQLSSVGDANSLMDVELGTYYHPHPHPHPNHRQSLSSQRLKELRRALVANSSKTATAPITDADCLSLDSQDWNAEDNNIETSQQQRYSDNETELINKPVAPVAPHIMAATMVATQPVSAVAELTVRQAPTRSRLKLSRIISRRDEDAFVTQATTSPRVELMRTHLPGIVGHQHIPVGRSVSSRRQNIDIFNSPKLRKSVKLSLAERLRWRTKRMKPASGGGGGGADQVMNVDSKAAVKREGGSKRERPESSSSSSTGSSGAGAAGLPTPTTALMRIAYPTTATVIKPSKPTTPTTETVMESEMTTRTNGGMPMAL